MQPLYATSRVLDVLQEELNSRSSAVDSTRAALDPASVRRLHRANLPGPELQRATDALVKLTALDKGRVEAEEVSPTGWSGSLPVSRHTIESHRLLL